MVSCDQIFKYRHVQLLGFLYMEDFYEQFIFGEELF